MRLIVLSLTILILVAACAPTITDFMSCVEAGNPVMESYPRQCMADGKVYVEEIGIPVGATECPDPRPTAATREYMPVMGSDGTRYDNWRLACMEQMVGWYMPIESGEELDMNIIGCQEQVSCSDGPVCGLVDNGIRCIKAPCQSADAKTFVDSCEACDSGAQGYYLTSCEDVTFVVCQDTVTGFDPVEHAKAIGGICVEICPGNFDPYMTQIGVELCIRHYDEKTISSWPVCDRSSATCDCVKAYETTDNTPIEDAQYRCVPQDYSERLLFRSGVDRLDEKGDRSVMIA